jgi:hypothetical protein
MERASFRQSQYRITLSAAPILKKPITVSNAGSSHTSDVELGAFNKDVDLLVKDSEDQSCELDSDHKD